MTTQHTPMVVAAAKVLCLRSSNTCNVDYDDAWRIYGEEYLEDAKAALDAAGAPDLLEELENCLDLLITCFPDAPIDSCIRITIAKAHTAIAKATGESS